MSCLPGMELGQSIPNKIPKHSNAVDLSFMAFQNRSSGTRNPNTKPNLRIRAITAETNEALEVAREIDNLVGENCSTMLSTLTFAEVHDIRGI